MYLKDVYKLNHNSMNFNDILGRTVTEQQIKEVLNSFDTTPLNKKRCVYIYGGSGVGKTTFVTRILNDLNYDIIKYDAGDSRNNLIIENLSNTNISKKNIISLFKKEQKKIAIIMDEIDGMNNGDKTGVSSLMKLVRPKKTKNQKLESYNINPIVFIGNTNVDKNIKFLMNVCHLFELNTPTLEQMTSIIQRLFPLATDIETIVNFINGDLSKLNMFYDIYKDDVAKFIEDINTILVSNTHTANRAIKTQRLFTEPHKLKEHSIVINDAERTIINLVWHENVVDILSGIKNIELMPKLKTYVKILDNICFADYIDRLTFQKQIWQLNEISSLIKTFKNTDLLHKFLQSHNAKHSKKQKDIRFTKILTRYSTEYNNFVFIRNICQTLNIDKSDLFSYLKNPEKTSELAILFENHDIELILYNRLLKYYNTYSNGGLVDPSIEDENICEEELEKDIPLMYIDTECI